MGIPIFLTFMVYCFIKPIALRKAKILCNFSLSAWLTVVCSFGLSECNRVNPSLLKQEYEMLLQQYPSKESTDFDKTLRYPVEI